jgi:alkanesulfonate monooxygenase SsuD/methylene tetrahydromethanopterin reductase-like flavin-dependent oxidoreductase (luciferase family)/predicted kinase
MINFGNGGGGDGDGAVEQVDGPGLPPPQIPRPALVLLIGPSDSGKTTWAGGHFAGNEVVSSDALRAAVGSGEGDLDASVDAFAVLDAIVAARLRRGLTTVIDTLGLDADRRAAALALGRAAGLPVLAVRFSTALDVCRARNRLRDRPVPAPVLRTQFTKSASLDLSADGFDLVLTVDTGSAEVGSASTVSTTSRPVDDVAPSVGRPGGLRFALQISSFPWGQDPRSWLAAVATAAERVGFAGIAVMDHLLQIPQVGRAWDPIPEAYVTLGYLAGVTERIELGALVTPVTFRSAPLLAKILASLDAVSGARAVCGIGAGWFEREHAGYGLPFPSARARLDELESTIGVLRAFWGPGTKQFGTLPESTCYPRPSRIPILVGGGGERRTLEIAARLADGCNLPSALPVLDHKLEVLRGHAERAGRPFAELRVTVLDLPIIGETPDEVARLVEAHRGRTTAKSYAAAHHAGTVDQHLARYRELADRGVHTVFVSFPDLAGPEQIERFAPILRAFG